MPLGIRSGWVYMIIPPASLSMAATTNSHAPIPKPHVTVVAPIMGMFEVPLPWMGLAAMACMVSVTWVGMACPGKSP